MRTTSSTLFVRVNTGVTENAFKRRPSYSGRRLIPGDQLWNTLAPQNVTSAPSLTVLEGNAWKLISSVAGCWDRQIYM